MIVKKRADAEIVETIKSGGVGVIPTDTIYGIVGSALREDTVQKIYELRQRDPKKPMIVLIGSMADLETFGVKLTLAQQKETKELWPGKVSIIFPCRAKKFAYLHRGTKTVAFRLPADDGLRKLLKKTGPLVAPSANMEGEVPARTITEAHAYFGDRINFYLDGGHIFSQPSTVLKLAKNGDVRIVR